MAEIVNKKIVNRVTASRHIEYLFCALCNNQQEAIAVGDPATADFTMATNAIIKAYSLITGQSMEDASKNLRKVAEQQSTGLDF